MPDVTLALTQQEEEMLAVVEKNWDLEGELPPTVPGKRPPKRMYILREGCQFNYTERIADAQTDAGKPVNQTVHVPAEIRRTLAEAYALEKKRPAA